MRNRFLVSVFLLLATGMAQPWLAKLKRSEPIRIDGAERNGSTIEFLDIDASKAPQGIRLEGGSDIVIRFCRIDGAKSANIMLKNARRITIRHCVISGGAEWGIQLSKTGGTEGVKIEDCEIYGADKDGIITGENRKAGVDHPGLEIRRNWVHHVASNLSWAGHFHGMYVQTAGFVVEDNLVTDIVDGNGLSFRSSGVARNNRVLRVGKSGIAYFNDHPVGEDKTMRWEGNRVWKVGGNPLLKADTDAGKNVPFRILEPQSGFTRVEKFLGSGNRAETGVKNLMAGGWDPETYRDLAITSDLNEAPSEADPRKAP